MSAVEWKPCPVMIERYFLPQRCAMAVGTVGSLELPPMPLVLMATRTLGLRTRKPRSLLRLMTLNTRGLQMRVFDSELCRAVIERPRRLPLLIVVAGLALQLGLMRIFVASLASGRFEPVLRLFMTRAALDAHMFARQRELGLLMPRPIELNLFESLHRVARITPATIREGSLVPVLMTLCALPLACNVDPLLSLRLMALCTIDTRMLPG